MTMAEVLDGIRGLGELFDRHAKRLAALERETGMDSDPDEDDEAKKAEEASEYKMSISGAGQRKSHRQKGGSLLHLNRPHDGGSWHQSAP